MNIYDKLLGGIGIGIVATMLALSVLPPIGMLAGLGTLMLIGVAMFVYTPVDTPSTTTTPTASYHTDD